MARNALIFLLCTLCLSSFCQIPFQVGGLEWPPNPVATPTVICTDAGTNVIVATLTNGVTTFQLLGSGGTFGISTIPTNGTLTSLNPTTGEVTYTETNGSALRDFASFYVSNAPTCVTNIPIYVNIATNLGPGNCFMVPNVGGGIVTGTIYFNISPSNYACISYLNQSCVTVTNCQFSDGNGVVRYDVMLGCGSSIYCIVDEESCSNLCLFASAHVSGVQTNAGLVNFNGTYNLQQFTLSPFQFFLTNSVYNSAIGEPAWLIYYPMGATVVAGVSQPQYAILYDGDGYIGDPVAYTITPVDCMSDIIPTNAWTLTSLGTNFYSLPTSSTITNTTLTNNCSMQ